MAIASFQLDPNMGVSQEAFNAHTHTYNRTADCGFSSKCKPYRYNESQTSTPVEGR